MHKINFHGKTFAVGSKVAKIAKVFSFKSFAIYGIHVTIYLIQNSLAVKKCAAPKKPL